MRQVELIKGIQSSVLGFGCAPVLGSVDAKKAKLAIEIALDCGINHFDLARSYGYGDAEKFVGRLLRPHRSKVVIATKFGIKANWKAKILAPLKPLVRVTMDRIKKNQPIISVSNENVGANYADSFFDRIPLSAFEMQKSVDQSLKQLNCDYIDYLFIHEPLQKILHNEELLEMAEKLKRKGKIRAFGLAYMRSQTTLHELYLDQFDLLQFDNSPGVKNYEDNVDKRGLDANIIFSPLRGGYAELTAEEKLITLSADFPNSVILCSMYDPKHLIQNASLFS